MCDQYVIKIIDKYILLKMFAIILANKWGITPRNWRIIHQEHLFFMRGSPSFRN
jgi:hypothetical protein